MTEQKLPSAIKKPLSQRIDWRQLGGTLSILLVGFIVGGIVMLLGGFNPVQVYAKLFDGVFGNAKNITNTIIKATPIIGTGLSIAFANRCGLFNIGAEGQFTIGTVVAGLLGYFLLSPAGVHPFVVVVCAGIAGGLWGALSGLFKARFGINEVISGIMLNWIGMHLRNIIVKIPGFERAPNANATFAIQKSAEIGVLEGWRESASGKAAIKGSKVLTDIFKTDINWGIVVVILLAIAVWFVLNKTTLGYRIKAVGANRHAAEYAGISVERSFVLSMFIAGALAGMAGGLLILGVQHNISYLALTEGYGFNGIAVALIGNSSPLGCVLSGLLLSALMFGGTKIQVAPINAPTEIINIMIGAIILFAGMPGLFAEIRRRRAARKPSAPTPATIAKGGDEA